MSPTPRFRATALALGLVLAAGFSSGRALASDKKPTPEPFYRKYLVAGDPLDDRIIEQEKRVEASPDDASLRNDFGNLLAERKFPAQAAEQYEIALKLDKKDFISAYNLGLLRETEGKISEAISAYKRSIHRKPGFPQSRFRLGRLYEHTNQPQPAVHEYAEALWIDPAMRDPKRNPLIVDCQLIYLASMANYERDIAVASMTDSKQYFDTDRFRKLPTTRVISSKEAEPSSDETESVAPRDVGVPGAAGTAGASEPARRGGARAVPPGGVAPGAPPPASGSRPAPGMRRTPLPHPQAAPPQQATPPPPQAPETGEAPPEAPPQEPAPEQTPPPEVEPSRNL